MSIRRALSILATLVLAYVVQTAVIADLAWPLVGPDLYLLTTLAWLLHLQVREAAVVGCVAGLLLDLAPPIDGPLGKWALLYIVAGVLLSRMSATLESPLARAAVLAVASAMAVIAGYLFSAILGEGQQVHSLPLIIIGIGLWNLTLAPVVLMAVRRTMQGTIAVEVLR